MFKAFKAKAQEAAADVKDKALDLKDKANDKLDKIKDKAEDKVDTIKDKAEDKVDDIKDKAEDAQDRATDVVDDAKEKTGLKDKVKGMADDFKNAAVWKAIKLWMDEHVMCCCGEKEEQSKLGALADMAQDSITDNLLS